MTLLIPDADQEILWLYLAGRYFVDAIVDGRNKGLLLTLAQQLLTYLPSVSISKCCLYPFC